MCSNRAELEDQFAIDTKSLENQRSVQLKESEWRHNKLMALNNQFASLQTTMEDAENEAHRWQAKWLHIQTTAAKKTLELGKTKM